MYKRLFNETIIKKFTKKQALGYIKLNISKQNVVFGIRGDDFYPSTKFRKSWNRPDGEKTTRLNGVSCMLVAQYNSWDDYPESIDKEVKNAKRYGQHIFLLQGTSFFYGNDEYDGLQEIIIRDHKIICEII